MGGMVVLFPHQQFGFQKGNFPVLLIGDGITDACGLFQLAFKHCLSGQKHLGVHTVGMKREGNTDGLHCVCRPSVHHIVFGDVGEVISVHVYRLFVRNGILILIKDFLKLSVLEI